MPRSSIVLDEESANFIRLANQPIRAAMVVDIFVRPGVDGVGAIEVGKQGIPFTLEGFRDYDDMEAAVEAQNTLQETIQGKIVTIYDAGEVEHTNMMCLRVTPGKPQPTIGMTGGLSDDMGAIATTVMEFVHMGPLPESP